MTPGRIARREAARLGRRSSAGGDPTRRVAPHLWLTARAKQGLKALSALPATPGRPASSTSPIQSTFPTVPAAAKSP
jgi:hypothetical protein